MKDDTVVVEGIRDKKVLDRLGFSDVRKINGSLYDFAMKFSGSVLVMTDFDPEGEKIAKKLSVLLTKAGCRVERAKRNKLRRLFIKNKVNTVEGMRRLMRF